MIIFSIMLLIPAIYCLIQLVQLINDVDMILSSTVKLALALKN